MQSDIKNNTKLLEDQTKNMGNTYIILEEMISSNKESLTKIDDDLKSIQNKDKVVSEDNDKVKSSAKCYYYNKGYCRSKSSCYFLHPTVLCEIENCDEKKCPNRHIKDCKNFIQNNCKFGQQCEFNHDSSKRIKMNQKIETENPIDNT